MQLILLITALATTGPQDSYHPSYWNNKPSGSDRWPPSAEQYNPDAEKKTGSDQWAPGSETFAPSSDELQPSSDWYLEQAATGATAQPSEADVFPQGADYYSYPEQAQDENPVYEQHPQSIPSIQQILEESRGTTAAPQGTGTGGGKAKEVSVAEAPDPKPLEGVSEVRAKELYSLNTDTAIMRILYAQLSPEGKQMWLQLPPTYREMATTLAQEDAIDGSFYNLNNPDQYVEKALEVYQETLIVPEQ